MSYYFNTVLRGKDFDAATEQVIEELKKEGFGILSEIDMSAAFKKKLDVDFKKYKILGACNPGFAYKALQAEEKVGVYLPCNVVVEENKTGEVEITIVDPVSSMISVKNDVLSTYSTEIQEKLKRVVANLN